MIFGRSVIVAIAMVPISVMVNAEEIRVAIVPAEGKGAAPEALVAKLGHC